MIAAYGVKHEKSTMSMLPSRLYRRAAAEMEPATAMVPEARARMAKPVWTSPSAAPVHRTCRPYGAVGNGFLRKDQNPEPGQQPQGDGCGTAPSGNEVGSAWCDCHRGNRQKGPNR
jgi:hypothetical protein